MAAPKSKVIAVRRGSVEVRIAPTQRAFTISWYEGGGRKRVRRADLEEAKLYAEEVATRIHNGQAGADLLTGDHRLSYLQAIDALSPTGVPLNEAVASFVAAHRLLGTRATLQDAVRFFLSHSQEISVRMLTKDAYAEFIENKTIRTSKRNVETTRLHVGRFAEYFKSRFLDEISHQQIDSYLRDVRQHRGRYFNNARTSLITFFRWARKAKYLGNFQTEADKIEKAQEVVEAVKIFTPAEFAKILGHVRSDLIPYLVLSAFAGLRPSEAARLEWADVHWEDGYLEIKASVAKKTLRNRFVPIQPNLKAWLEPFRRETGLVGRWEAPRYLLGEEVKRLTKKRMIAGWSPDVLRHSYGSYRLALLRDRSKLSDEMGNSPEVIVKNYRRPVIHQQAEAWFAIAPSPRQLDSFSPRAKVES